MITADQIIIDAIGDYVLQSDWMANEKTKQHFAALCHAFVYSLLFLPLCWHWSPWYGSGDGMTATRTFPDLLPWLVIFGTHFLIDRYRLARYIVWAKNWMAPVTWWKLSKSTGVWTGSDRQTNACFMTWIDFGEPTPCPEFLKDVLTMKKGRTLSFSDCIATGYPPDRPAWLAVWLLIFADNILHICINGAALRWL